MSGRITLTPTWRRYNGDEQRVQRAMARERFILPKGTSVFMPCTRHAKSDNIGEKIDIAIAAIEDANKAKLEGVFQNITFN